MSTGWRYELTAKAIRDIERLDPQVRSRVFDALDRLVEQPFTPQLRKPRGKQGELRYRVGDWRIRVERDGASGSYAYCESFLAVPPIADSNT
jgi:mRNA-degrading endonuclease RelE of RelBE toxin-antitoxin system